MEVEFAVSAVSSAEGEEEVEAASVLASKSLVVVLGNEEAMATSTAMATATRMQNAKNKNKNGNSTNSSGMAGSSYTSTGNRTSRADICGRSRRCNGIWNSGNTFRNRVIPSNGQETIKKERVQDKKECSVSDDKSSIGQRNEKVGSDCFSQLRPFLRGLRGLLSGIGPLYDPTQLQGEHAAFQGCWLPTIHKLLCAHGTVRNPRDPAHGLPISPWSCWIFQCTGRYKKAKKRS